MNRLRLVFVLLILGLLIPGGLLVRRALESVQVERAARHRAVAERILDEMERSLSEFLRVEEERPHGHYRYAWSPPGSPEGVVFRSPLANPRPEQYVIGHFAVDDRGRVHTPLRPLPGEAPPDWPPQGQLAEERAIQVLSLVVRAWPSEPEPPTWQKPGTTVAVGLAAEQEEMLRDKAEALSPADDAYGILQSLNRGAELRRDRSQKVVQLDSLELETELEPAYEEKLAEVLGRGRPAETPETEVLGYVEEAPDAFASAAANRPAPGEAPGKAKRAERDEPARPRLPAAIPPSTEATVDPMLGFALDDDYLVLHRTVWEGQRATRQGLIVDVDKLAEHLLQTALPGRSVGGAHASIGPAEGEGSAAHPGEFHYRHRFAEPFHALAVDLELPPLPGASGERIVTVLSLALLFGGGLGLFALYRMVRVVVRFSERRSNFVAAVSHELKTPVTAIRMYAEMLRDGIVPDGDKQQEYYGTITAESERLSRLIDNVLEFSKLEKGTREMSWCTADLGSLVEEAVGVLGPHAAAQGFELEAQVEPGLPEVRFDRDAVLQVLFNLVDNALKYARDAQDRTIEVECRREGEGVRLLVRDRGPGVPSEHLGQIFEPFYRGENELTRRAQGAGIGLSLVKGLAEQMEAMLRAHNPAGGGFEVALTFPPS